MVATSLQPIKELITWKFLNHFETKSYGVIFFHLKLIDEWLLLDSFFFISKSLLWK